MIGLLQRVTRAHVSVDGASVGAIERGLLVLIGVVLFGVGLVGEYVGRIYQQVRDRPRYTIRAVLESVPKDPA